MFSWHYSPNVKDINPKKIKLTENKVQLKHDCNYGSVSNGVRRPIVFGFELNKFLSFKTFCEPETTHH